jgi:uncharacterized lipoprotein YajG
LKSSSSEEFARKQSLTSTTVCNTKEVITAARDDMIGEKNTLNLLLFLTNSLLLLVACTSQKYSYHDEPHSFETSMDYLVVASDSINEIGLLDAESSKNTESHDIHDINPAEHIYSNSDFRFEVLETTV